MFRIFVFGFPRSGTTLLQSLLGAHPDFMTFPESHLLSESFRVPHWYFPFPTRNSSLRAVVQQFLTCSQLEVPQDPTLYRDFEDLDRRVFPSPSDAACVAIRFYDALAALQNSSGWLKKTPDHLLHWHAFEKASKNARFVHIARAPVPTILSYCEAARRWPGAPTCPRKSLGAGTGL